MMKKYFLLLFFFSVFIQDIYSQSNTTHLNLNSKNIAVDGYDLVSYFEENKAVTGKKIDILTSSITSVEVNNKKVSFLYSDFISNKSTMLKL
jgi:hypothetical protein